MRQTLATNSQYKCNDCLPLWDRTGNVKAIQLCSLHQHTKTLLKALKEAKEVIQTQNDGNCLRSILEAITKAEEK